MNITDNIEFVGSVNIDPIVRIKPIKLAAGLTVAFSDITFQIDSMVTVSALESTIKFTNCKFIYAGNNNSVGGYIQFAIDKLILDKCEFDDITAWIIMDEPTDLKSHSNINKHEQCFVDIAAPSDELTHLSITHCKFSKSIIQIDSMTRYVRCNIVSNEFDLCHQCVFVKAKGIMTVNNNKFSRCHSALSLQCVCKLIFNDNTGHLDMPIKNVSVLINNIHKNIPIDISVRDNSINCRQLISAGGIDQLKPTSDGVYKYSSEKLDTISKATNPNPIMARIPGFRIIN